MARAGLVLRRLSVTAGRGDPAGHDLGERGVTVAGSPGPAWSLASPGRALRDSGPPGLLVHGRRPVDLRQPLDGDVARLVGQHGPGTGDEQLVPPASRITPGHQRAGGGVAASPRSDHQGHGHRSHQAGDERRPRSPGTARSGQPVPSVRQPQRPSRRAQTTRVLSRVSTSRPSSPGPLGQADIHSWLGERTATASNATANSGCGRWRCGTSVPDSWNAACSANCPGPGHPEAYTNEASAPGRLGRAAVLSSMSMGRHSEDAGIRRTRGGRRLCT